MNDVYEAARKILVDLTEIQPEVSMVGLESASKKINAARETALKLARAYGKGQVTTVVQGYRQDAMGQLERMHEGLVKVADGSSPVTDNELLFLSMAAEQFTKCVQTYMSKKMLAECPGMREVLYGS